MSYRLNKTNGELLVELVDGQIDTSSTDITLIGRNYKGFGEAVNENFIKMLENFAKTSAPGAPLVGQLWYDTAEERLKVYTGETFRSAAGAVISQTQPNLVAGDLWIDSLNNKLYFFDGADLVLVGPQYTASQGKTGPEAFTVLDENGQDQTVVYLYINGTLSGIYSRTQFRPRVNIVGFPQDPDDTRNPKRQLIKPGFNPVSSEFWWRGTAQSTASLIDENSLEEFTVDSFMKTDRPTETEGTITVKDEGGISVGVGATVYTVLKIDTTNNYITSLENQRQDRDFAIRTRTGNALDNAFYADASEKRVGIFTDTPQVELDVVGDGQFSGDLTIGGSLTVTGDTTYLDVTSLRVQDKTIELALTSDSTLLPENDVDGAGIIIRAAGDDKTWTWQETDNAWTSSEHIDIPNGKSYKIDGTNKLSANRIDDSVLYAEGLIRVGSLLELTVAGDVTIDENLTVDNPLNIISGGIITINNKNITGVLDPVDPQDVATKNYVDTQIDSEPVVLSLDVTGLSNPSGIFSDNVGPHTDVKGILDYMYPATGKEIGTVARVYALTYTSASVSGIDISPGVTKSQVSVFVDPEDSSTPQLEPVLRDIEFAPVSATASLSPSRAKMEFEVVNSGGTNIWSWQRTIPV